MATERRSVSIWLRQTPTTYRDAAAILPSATMRQQQTYPRSLWFSDLKLIEPKMSPLEIGIFLLPAMARHTKLIGLELHALHDVNHDTIHRDPKSRLAQIRVATFQRRFDKGR